MCLTLVATGANVKLGVPGGREAEKKLFCISLIRCNQHFVLKTDFIGT